MSGLEEVGQRNLPSVELSTANLLHDTSISLAEAYKQWKAEFIQEYLPGKSNPYGDDTNWLQVFENGSNLQKDLTY
jgi:hypothetical protein